MTDLLRLPARSKDGELHVVVESQRGATVKLRYEPELGAFTLDRPLPLGMVYPHDWGFVPSTRAQDGDPLDALVVWDQPSYPGTVLRCRVIGVVELEQDEDGKKARNDRILAVPVSIPRETVESALDLPERIREEICHFFVANVELEGKKVRVLGVKGPAEADAIVEASLLPGARRKAA